MAALGNGHLHQASEGMTVRECHGYGGREGDREGVRDGRQGHGGCRKQVTASATPKLVGTKQHRFSRQRREVPNAVRKRAPHTAGWIAKARPARANTDESRSQALPAQ
jgi:hypothetical protein